jgi:hypothetical protein
VNIVGPGIFDAAGGQEDLDEILDDLYSGESSCTYKGVLSQFVPTSSGSGSAELTLNVPVGSSRVVQVAGASPSSGSCNFDVDGEIDLFEWGRAITGIFGPTNISVTAHPDTTSGLPMREMKCGGGDAIESTEGKLLWFAAEDLCQGVNSGDSAPGSWVSRVNGWLITKAGEPTCMIEAGRRYVKSAAPADVFSTSIPASDERTRNLQGVTAFVVGRFSTGTLNNKAYSVQLIAGASDYFKVRHELLSGSFQRDNLEAQVSGSSNFSEGVQNSSVGVLRVFGGRTRNDGLKVRSGSSNQSSGATLGLFNPSGNALGFNVGKPIDSNTTLDVFEVLVFRRPLSDSEFDAVDVALRQKYSLP